jgi:hypothetical protein
MTTLREAAQQALEALENCTSEHGHRCNRCDSEVDEGGRVITALRAALAQQEQTCNCRWVGDVQTQQCTLHEAHVDAIHEWAERAKTAEAALAQQEQEPLSVEDLARALVASRVIDAAALDDPEGYDDGVMLERVRGLHRRLAALAQQEQEPVAWTDRELQLIDGMIEVQLHHAAQCDGIANRTMAEKQKGWDMERVALLQKIKSNPPRREWQSLTEEELAELARQEQLLLICDDSDARREIARAIEQALKERNT